MNLIIDDPDPIFSALFFQVMINHFTAMQSLHLFTSWSLLTIASVFFAATHVIAFAQNVRQTLVDRSSKWVGQTNIRAVKKQR